MKEVITCCRFCNIFEGIYSYDGIDNPFASNDQFIAIASIGAIVEGWSLIIPKKHQFSMKHCYNDSEFKNLVEKVIPLMVEKYGNLIAFEHGSNQEGSATACGTNHAHLHLVPFRDEGLLSELKKSNMKWDACTAFEIAEKTGDNEYLFYYDLKKNMNWNNPIGYLHILQQPTSQFFRHLIASRLDCPEVSNYREFPFLENAKETRKTLA